MRSFKQRDLTDCGAACFAFVCEHYRLHLSLAQVRHALGTNQSGTTAASLVHAAQQLGFSARGVKGPPEALATVPLPGIAHCQLPGNRLHYVVLVRWTRRRAWVMDPAVGRVEKWPAARFLAQWTGVLILLAPGERFQSGDRTVSPLRRLWTLLGPHRGILAQSLLGAIVATALGLGMSAYVQGIVDHVIPDGNRPLLHVLGFAMVAMLIFRTVLTACQSLISVRMAQHIDAALILAYHRHLLRLPQVFFDTMRVGEIGSRIGDAIKVRHFLNATLVTLLLNPLIVLFSLGAMACWSPPLAALSLVLLPVNGLIYWAINRWNRDYCRRGMERAADYEAQLVETLQAQPTIRRFLLEPVAAWRHELRLVRLLKATGRAALGGIGANAAVTLATQAYLIGLLWIGAGLVLDVGLSPGQLMSCYTLAGYLSGPINGLVGLNESIQEALIATDRLFELMDLEREPDHGLIEFTHGHAGEVRFEQVNFRHAGRLATLQDITLALPAGRISALIGESGCGKSTLLALVQRLYLPESGRIFIGGHDLRHFRLRSLRRHLAVVPQQIQLWSGTVLENLAPGEEPPDLERVVHLCHEVGAHEFIEKLPQGYFTPLPENGGNLSGGQRQRIALVRALYRDAPILLLDEPTSALDHAAESQLLATLVRLRRQGCTVIVAAHSTGVLQIADIVVTLAGGKALTVRKTESAHSPLPR